MDDQEKAELVRTLDNLILKVVAGAQTRSKYGGTLYTLYPDEKEAQFCGVFSYKAHVQLAFSQGTQLTDPANLLEGDGKFRRHINVKNIQEINIPAVSRLLKEAAALSECN